MKVCWGYGEFLVSFRICDQNPAWADSSLRIAVSNEALGRLLIVAV